MSAEAARSHAAPHRDDVASRIGMWIFLLTELFLFGGIFIAYAAYRSVHREAFHHAGAELDAVLGVFNTIVLLTSSLTVALGIHAFRERRDRLAPCWIGLTVLLAFAFLVVKGIEWGTKYQHGLFPGQAGLAALPPGERLFFGLYFAATGLHALHVIAGAVLLGVTCVLVAKQRIRPESAVILENAGIYWHLVDTIWIIILPLFYLAA